MTDNDPQAVRELLTALRIERGHPEPEELAALTVVLTSRLSQPSAPEGFPPVPAPRSRWADPRHVLGLPPVPGRGSWRASALPR
ncbi:acyl-CoA carboxylase subunit epsilon [Kineococcus sp. NBC_00420]|uniref:acyl-CoA carboxylase subunit epsilon n=1 Tax=unclassified Kineococcus TaxID=2621656 RepID=UPI002E1A66A6